MKGDLKRPITIKHFIIQLMHNIQGPAEIPDDLAAAVSGVVGVGNLSLSTLLARLKAFQLPRSAGL